jgi:hypothetical protein
VFGHTDEEPGPQSRIGATTTAVEPDADGGGGVPEGLILLLFAIVTLAASAWLLGGEERDAANDPAKKAERGEIHGFDGLSLAREENLQKALDKVGASRRPLVMTIRVAPDRVNLGVRDADGSREQITVDPGFGITSTDAGVGEDDAIPAGRIDAGAPARIMRTVAARTKLPLDSFDYASMIVMGGLPRQWFLTLKQGPARTRQWMAAGDGSDVRKPGAPSREQRAVQAKIKRRSDCLHAARTARAVQACIARFRQ